MKSGILADLEPWRCVALGVHKTGARPVVTPATGDSLLGGRKLRHRPQAHTDPSESRSPATSAATSRIVLQEQAFPGSSHAPNRSDGWWSWTWSWSSSWPSRARAQRAGVEVGGQVPKLPKGGPWPTVITPATTTATATATILCGCRGIAGESRYLTLPARILPSKLDESKGLR